LRSAVFKPGAAGEPLHCETAAQAGFAGRSDLSGASAPRSRR
jgi:hypothetical protein